MRVLFIGTGEIGVPVLRSLLNSKEHELVGVVTQPDKPVGREQRIEAPPIKAALAGSTLPILQPERIKREEAVGGDSRARAGCDCRDGLRPNSAAIGARNPAHCLFEPACLAAAAPSRRGADSGGDCWPAIASRVSPSCTWMKDSTLATSCCNRASRSRRTKRADRSTIGWRRLRRPHWRKRSRCFKRGNAPRVPQDSSAATYAPKLERENGRIDWTESATVIERKIRAFNPWPGAFTILRDEAGRERKLKIFSAKVVAAAKAAPGEVFRSDGSIVIGGKRWRVVVG